MDFFADAGREAIRLLLTGGSGLWRIVALSLRVGFLGLLLGAVVGIPLGAAVALGRFRGRNTVIALIQTGYALPPVVVGLFVYMLLSRAGPFGTLALLFTPTAMVLAQALLAGPYVAGITLSAVQAVPPDVRLQARALGASRVRALLTHLREARFGLLAALVAGFGAVMSEVGAVMMVGGNVEGSTRVMTTAIVLETRRGDFGVALALGVLLLLIAFAVNVGVAHAQQERSARVRPWM